MCQLWVNYLNGLMVGPIILYMGYRPNPMLLKILGVVCIGYNVYQIAKKQGWIDTDFMGNALPSMETKSTDHSAAFFDRREFNTSSSSAFSNIGLRKSLGFQKI